MLSESPPYMCTVPANPRACAPGTEHGIRMFRSSESQCAFLGSEWRGNLRPLEQWVLSTTFSPSTTSTTILPPKVVYHRWKSIDFGDKSHLVWDLVCPTCDTSVIIIGPIGSSISQVRMRIINFLVFSKWDNAWVPDTWYTLCKFNFLHSPLLFLYHLWSHLRSLGKEWANDAKPTNTPSPSFEKKKAKLYCI